MKHFGKNSISSALRIIIDLALVLELLTVAVTLWQIFQYLPPKNDSGKIMLFAFLSQFIFGIISFLITLQLRKLINAFKKEAFFELKNVKRIQNISLLLFLYVISDIALSQFNPNQRSIEIISRIAGNMPFIDYFLSFVSAINFKILFLSAVIYVISRVFKNGYELKEQTTLTI
jgi:hypothetical protein